MKKIATIVCVMALNASVCIASNSTSETTTFTTVETSSAGISVPTGTFYNNNDFIYIRGDRSWLRIVIKGQPKEYSFDAQRDPQNNYVLKFGDGECITIYSNGRSLYYNGTTYKTKSIYN